MTKNILLKRGIFISEGMSDYISTDYKSFDDVVEAFEEFGGVEIYRTKERLFILKEREILIYKEGEF